MSRITELLPDADVVTRHETTIPLPPGEALALVLETPAAADRLTGLLLRLRGLSSGRTIAEVLPELERSETEAVFGLAGKPWLPRGAPGSFHEPRPGTVRIAAGFRADPSAGGARVVIETRVAAVDERARRAFARYWRVVGPFSSLVRRRWLAAAARRAGRGRTLCS